MAFTVEDGSGIAGANAYILVQFFRDHHIDRGNTAHADFIDSEVQSGIIRASDFVDKRFGRRFVGSRQTKSQGLEWPRLNAFDMDGFLLSDIDEVPRQLMKAVAEYALRALICGVLAPDPLLPVPKQDLTDSSGTRDTDTVTGEVQRKRERVGPLEEETWYQTQSQVIAKNLAAGATSVKSGLVNDFVIPEYPEADMWIEELLRNQMTIRLVRGD
jgi:hypothetical protein